MSHLKERKEKICLNCNAAIYGRYCHVCGQENLDPKESFWHLVTHFLFDLIHFDGKFFSTLKYLLFKPGHLPAEHLCGRRADYLHPIRMYVFVSAFFFLIMFSFYGSHKNSKVEKFEKKVKKFELLKNAISKEEEDSLNVNRLVVDSFNKILETDIRELKRDSLYDKPRKSDSLNIDLISSDSIINKINKTAINATNNGIGGILGSIFQEKREKYNSDDEFNEKIQEELIHAIPKGLFFAVPFYALFLFIIYYRNKKYNYVNHIIFSIYLFCFTFILILFAIWINSISKKLHLDLNGYIVFASFILAMLYTYKALRNFYQQSRIKTILKFLILSCCCILGAILVFALAFFFSYLKI